MTRRFPLVFFLSFALCTAFSLAGAAAANAQAGGERIAELAIQAEIRSDGVIAVTETIDYDFGQNDRHGFLREIDTREPAGDDVDRVYRVTDVEVTSPSGAPDQVEVETGETTTTIRIGDPDRTVTGRHSYRLNYLLHGHLNAFDDHDELFWEATGSRWSAPITEVTVTV